ncbi:MAG: CPBP family glutamic-type intramembrane protease [Candidatus Helarchaeales archaeon]
MVEWKEIFSRKRILVLSSVIGLTVIYYVLALAYIPVSPTQKKLIFYNLFFSNLPLSDYWQYIFQFILAFLLFFIVPVLIIKLIFKEKLVDYGFSLEKKKLIIIFLALAIGIMLPLAFIQSFDPLLQSTYPMTRIVTQNFSLLIIYETCYVAFYYLSYETIYRGYLQFGLKTEDTTEKGIWLIIIIQTIITVLFHVGKPTVEIFGALIAGIIFGYIALKCKSILPVLVGHAILGVALDLFSTLWSVIL